jgi:hypothetical protein
VGIPDAIKFFKNMKQVLVLYYSQTGQLKEIVDSVLMDVASDAEVQIVYKEYEPSTPYPFPWTSEAFFDAFPESVKSIPCVMKPVEGINNADFDLIIFAYQPWYLSPSIPSISFLKTPQAAKLFNGKPVITIIGSRNMWIQSQQVIKSQIKDIGGKLCGNIVLFDRNNNLISVITIIKWLFSGIKKFNNRWLPDAGVSDKDIQDSSKYGKVILNAIKNNEYNSLQEQLLMKGAVEIKPDLMFIENNGKRIFGIWASIILNKSKKSLKSRRKWLIYFKYYLFFVIYAVSPIATLFFYLTYFFRFAKIKKRIREHSLV